MIIFTFLVLIIFLGYYFLSLRNTFEIIPFNTNSDLKKKFKLNSVVILFVH